MEISFIQKMFASPSATGGPSVGLTVTPWRFCSALSSMGMSQGCVWTFQSLHDASLGRSHACIVQSEPRMCTGSMQNQGVLSALSPSGILFGSRAPSFLTLWLRVIVSVNFIALCVTQPCTARMPAGQSRRWEKERERERRDRRNSPTQLRPRGPFLQLLWPERRSFSCILGSLSLPLPTPTTEARPASGADSGAAGERKEKEIGDSPKLSGSWEPLFLALCLQRGGFSRAFAVDAGRQEGEPREAHHTCIFRVENGENDKNPAMARS